MQTLGTTGLILIGRSRQYRSGGAGAAWERRAHEQAEHREQLPTPGHSPPRYATGPCTHAGSPRPSCHEWLLPSGPCGCTRARSLRMLPIELVQVREGAHSLLGILLRVRHLSRLDCARQARAKVSLCVEGVGPSWCVQARPSRLRLRRMRTPSSWAWRRAWACCPATCVRSRASGREAVVATAGIRTLVCSGLAGALTSPRIRASKASMSSIASCPSS